MSQSTSTDTASPCLTSADDSTTTSFAPEGTGMGLVVYGAGAFFVVLVLFAICIGADALGRKATDVLKRIAFTDGVGNVSIIAEIAAFIIVLVLVAIFLKNSFEYENASRSPPSTCPPAPSNSNSTTSAVSIFGDTFNTNAGGGSGGGTSMITFE